MTIVGGVVFVLLLLMAGVIGYGIGKRSGGDSGSLGGPPAAGRQTTAPKAVAIRGDGTYLIGSDIQPGQYRATVPSNSVGCYWERLKGTSGSLDDVIANDTVAVGAQALVTIEPSDKAFKTQGCGSWEKIG